MKSKIQKDIDNYLEVLNLQEEVKKLIQRARYLEYILQDVEPTRAFLMSKTYYSS